MEIWKKHVGSYGNTSLEINPYVHQQIWKYGGYIHTVHMCFNDIYMCIYTYIHMYIATNVCTIKHRSTDQKHDSVI